MTTRHQFEVRLEGPIDFAASLEIFRRSGDDLIDRWDGEWLTRTARLDGHCVAYTCRPAGTLEAPALIVMVEDPVQAPAIARALSKSFVRLTPEFADLCRTDPVIGRLARLHRGFRPILHLDLMVALVRCISAQQVNLKWAATVRRRLAESYGRRHEVGGQVVYSLDPERLARCDIADIRALQFTTGKAEYVINAARAVARGELEVEQLNALPDDDVIARVTAVRGLGLWSAEWVLARTLGRPRISAGDLGVRKAVGKAYFTMTTAPPVGERVCETQPRFRLGRPPNGKMPAPEEVRAATAHWGAATALAQELLLHAQHQKTLAGGSTVIAPPAAQSRSTPKRKPRAPSTT
jgi:DNA-3-methyladenine glycosylase II